MSFIYNILRVRKGRLQRLKKVLVGAIYAAKKPAKMPGERNDGHGHSFQSEAEDWMVPSEICYVTRRCKAHAIQMRIAEVQPRTKCMSRMPLSFCPSS